MVRKKGSPKVKDNPLLMMVGGNPPPELETLWQETRGTTKQANKLTKKKFFAACEQYRENHGRYPNEIDVVGIECEGINENILICMGDLLEATYLPHRGSRKNRKGDIAYKHKFDQQKIVTNATGDFIATIGKAKVKKGWIHF